MSNQPSTDVFSNQGRQIGGHIVHLFRQVVLELLSIFSKTNNSDGEFLDV